jgi:hypothetical protein
MENNRSKSQKRFNKEPQAKKKGGSKHVNLGSVE